MKKRNNAYIGLTCIPTTGAEGAVINFRGFWRKHFLPRKDDHQDEGLNSISNVLLNTPTNHLFAKSKKNLQKQNRLTAQQISVIWKSHITHEKQGNPLEQSWKSTVTCKVHYLVKDTGLYSLFVGCYWRVQNTNLI